jgi:hypothetical protein
MGGALTPPATTPLRIYRVLDRYGGEHYRGSLEDCEGYARLWDRDTPGDAPHRVERVR